MRRELVHDGGDLRDLLFVDMAKLREIADVCKARANEGMHQFTADGMEIRHLAEFPPELVEKYIADTGITFSEWMRNPEHHRRMLKDPALADFRIAPPEKRNRIYLP